MPISKNKVMLQVPITKELNDTLNAIVEDSRRDGKSVSKSQLVEVSIRLFINSCIKQAAKQKEEN